MNAYSAFQLPTQVEDTHVVVCGPGVYTPIITLVHTCKWVQMFILTTAITVVNMGFGPAGLEVLFDDYTLAVGLFIDGFPLAIPAATRVALNPTVAIAAELHFYF
jgi:hypothetical protein